MTFQLPPSQPDELFQRVERRNKKRKGRTNPRIPVTFEAQYESVWHDIGNSTWMAEWHTSVKVALDKLKWVPSELFVLCLGLGSPIKSKTSAVQLVSLTSLCDNLGIARKDAVIFDPQFLREDVQGLADMGFSISTENKRGRYILNHNMLIFMPHCGVELYENLLRENWSCDRLRRILLIGNNLEEYATSAPASKLEQTTPCLSRLWRHLCSDPVPPLEAYPLSFNNIAVQYVTDMLPAGELAFWQIPHIDDNDSVEVI